MKTAGIKIGDKFKAKDGYTREVIGTKPGGRVELFDRERKLFTDRWFKDVITWQRVDETDNKPN